MTTIDRGLAPVEATLLVVTVMVAIVGWRALRRHLGKTNSDWLERLSQRIRERRQHLFVSRRCSHGRIASQERLLAAARMEVRRRQFFQSQT